MIRSRRRGWSQQRHSEPLHFKPMPNAGRTRCGSRRASLGTGDDGAGGRLLPSSMTRRCQRGPLQPPTQKPPDPMPPPASAQRRTIPCTAEATFRGRLLGQWIDDLQEFDPPWQGVALSLN